VTKFKRLVYIPEVNKRDKVDTWRLLTQGRGTCLRNYLAPNPPTEDRSFSVGEIKEMLKTEGAYSEKLPTFSKISYEDDSFWREQIELRNLEFSDKQQRLLDDFVKQCHGAFKQRSPAKALQAVFERWIYRFSCIVRKAQFNHWDDDCADCKFSVGEGIGWTSKLLESSRKGKVLSYIKTGNCDTNFSLLCMELSLGISSNNNLFRKTKAPDFIKPDGLGIRECGSFTIFEVKGPKDDRTLINPMLQAVCGALAVYSKREMLCRIAKKEGGRRPAVKLPRIPKRGRSLGVHVLSQANGNGGPRTEWTDETTKWCQTVAEAFPQLKYIAYSFISTDQAKSFSKIKIDQLILGAESQNA
jgi:hypothetical protein